MATRIVDLSLTVEPNESEPVPVQIERISHAVGGDLLGKPGGITREAFPGGIGLSLEHVSLVTHAGTHVDAPAHYGPLSEGRPARTIDELPLDWFFGHGVLLDCRGPEREPIDRPELEARLASIGYALKPLDIVLIRTDADRLWGTPAYFTSFRGLTREATAFLVTQGVKVIGVDTFGFDAPFDQMLENYNRSGDPGALWPAHMYGREREYCQIERLARLADIERPYGFKVACFPVKLRGCGAGWSRVVAVVED